jgi:hypothetical protein
MFVMPGMCVWCHCLDHAGLRYLVVMSDALQLVVVTPGDRAGSPPSALGSRPLLTVPTLPNGAPLGRCVSSLLKEA